MVTLDTLRLEKKSEIIRLAELRGCRNVRVLPQQNLWGDSGSGSRPKL